LPFVDGYSLVRSWLEMKLVNNIVTDVEATYPCDGGYKPETLLRVHARAKQNYQLNPMKSYVEQFQSASNHDYYEWYWRTKHETY
jgi:hypothetical protein